MTVSAGILLYRRNGPVLEVLLAHPGGPFFARKDDGHWSIPKGEIDMTKVTEPSDTMLLAEALREFAEETGSMVDGHGAVALGHVRQRGGKVVHAFACTGDFDAAELRSNTFRLEWLPRSGRVREWPEIDAVGWFPLPVAHRKILPAQAPLLDRLARHLGEPTMPQ